MRDDNRPERPEAPSGGELLRLERLRRRLSLLDVGQQTRIHPRLLEAIESNDDRSLPAPVNTVGLIATYARFLGVDPTPVVSAYRERTSHKGASPRPEGLRRPSRGVGVPAIAFPVIVAGLVVGLALYLYQQYATYVADATLLRARPLAGVVLPPTPRSESDLPVVSPTATSIPTPVATAVLAVTAISGPAAPTPTPAPPPPTAVPTATPNRDVHIDAKATGRVWVQVEADDKVIFSGILNPGDLKSWTAKQKLMVWAGNAANVTVIFNGKSLGPLGRPGEVLKVTWTASST